MREPFEPPTELFQQLQKNLKAEMETMAQKSWLSDRVKLHRLMRQLKPFAGTWLERIAPPRDQTARRRARQIFQATIPRIVRAITAREALGAVKLPRRGIGAIVYEAGQMTSAEPEYPDRPFPETPEKLAHWKREITRLRRVEARRAKAAEEIQFRPYGIFERAMAPEWLQEAISFRPSIERMEEELRRHLMWHVEKLRLDYPLRIPESESLPEPASASEVPEVEAQPKPAVVFVPVAAQKAAVNTMIEAARQSADPVSAFEELQKRAKWERKSWAEAAGLSQPTISRIFQGKGSKNSLRKFSRALAERLAKLPPGY